MISTWPEASLAVMLELLCSLLCAKGLISSKSAPNCSGGRLGVNLREYAPNMSFLLCCINANHKLGFKFASSTGHTMFFFLFSPTEGEAMMAAAAEYTPLKFTVGEKRMLPPSTPPTPFPPFAPFHDALQTQLCFFSCFIIQCRAISDQRTTRCQMLKFCIKNKLNLTLLMR